MAVGETWSGGSFQEQPARASVTEPPKKATTLQGTLKKLHWLCRFSFSFEVNVTVLKRAANLGCKKPGWFFRGAFWFKFSLDEENTVQLFCSSCSSFSSSAWLLALGNHYMVESKTELTKRVELLNLGVSKNGGTLKSSILIGFSSINHPYWGTTILGNPHLNLWGWFIQKNPKHRRFRTSWVQVFCRISTLKPVGNRELGWPAPPL